MQTEADAEAEGQARAIGYVSTIFLASFPPIQSALKVNGIKEGMRIQLDIPESEMAQAVNLLRWREMPLEVTIRPAQNNRADMGNGKKQYNDQAGRGAKSRWASAEVEGTNRDIRAGRQ
jgi:hypothetical protein